MMEEGIQINNGPKLIGATDDELDFLMQDFHLKRTSLRYYRWMLIRDGYVEDSGLTRSIIKGKRGMKVWVIKSKTYNEVMEDNL